MRFTLPLGLCLSAAATAGCVTHPELDASVRDASSMDAPTPPADAGGCGESYIAVTYSFPGQPSRSACVAAVIDVRYVVDFGDRCVLSLVVAGSEWQGSGPSDELQVQVHAGGGEFGSPPPASSGVNVTLLTRPGPCAPLPGILECRYQARCDVHFTAPRLLLGDLVQAELASPCEMINAADPSDPSRPSMGTLTLHGPVAGAITLDASGGPPPFECPR